MKSDIIDAYACETLNEYIDLPIKLILNKN